MSESESLSSESLSILSNVSIRLGQVRWTTYNSIRRASACLVLISYSYFNGHRVNLHFFGFRTAPDRSLYTHLHLGLSAWAADGSLEMMNG